MAKIISENTDSDADADGSDNENKGKFLIKTEDLKQMYVIFKVAKNTSFL